MPLILLTNDDGINAPGLAALERAMSALGETLTVAPDRERSGAGHSLTMQIPLKVTTLSKGRYSLNGTPTDCVIIGSAKIAREKPALIVSGINNGPNLADDITYSGTVAGAIEGTLHNIPSIAISVNAMSGQEPIFETAARMATDIASMVLEHHLPYDTLLNVNVPNLPYNEIKGTRFTRQGRRMYEGSIQDAASPWGEHYYWIGGGTMHWERAEDTDIHTVRDGYVSITPIHLDLTNHSALELIERQWKKRSSKEKEI